MIVARGVTTRTTPIVKTLTKTALGAVFASCCRSVTQNRFVIGELREGCNSRLVGTRCVGVSSGLAGRGRQGRLGDGWQFRWIRDAIVTEYCKKYRLAGGRAGGGVVCSFVLGVVFTAATLVGLTFFRSAGARPRFKR